MPYRVWFLLSFLYILQTTLSFQRATIMTDNRDEDNTITVDCDEINELVLRDILVQTMNRSTDIEQLSV